MKSKAGRKQRSKENLLTITYPCGCSATGSESVPRYCPEHGTAPKGDSV